MKTLRNCVLAISALLVLALVAAGPASAADRNHDKIPDRWEKRHNLSLEVNQAKRDQDRDQLNNRGEFRSSSDPRDDDTDDDGIEDGDENAGTVASFDGTTLTINLLNGGTITGTVDENTEVKCGDECDHDGDESGHGHGDGDNSGPSDNSGPGSHADRRDHGDDDDADTDEDEGDDDGDCSVDDLAEGVAIHEAEIRLKNGDAVFREIELAK